MHEGVSTCVTTPKELTRQTTKQQLLEKRHIKCFNVNVSHTKDVVGDATRIITLEIQKSIGVKHCIRDTTSYKFVIQNNE